MKVIGVDDMELETATSRNPRSTAQTRMTNEEVYRESFIGNLDFNSVSKPYDVLEEIVEFPG